MNHLALLLLCLGAGVVLRQLGRMPDNAPVTLNGFIVHISLPALVLLHIHQLVVSREVLLVGAMAWILFVLAAGFFWLLGRWLRLEPATTGALILTGGLGNTSFLGLPMVAAYFGDEGLTTAIIADQLGSFFALSLLGIPVAGIYSSGAPAVADILRRILRFPPFIALILAVLLLPLEYPAWVTGVLTRLGDTLAPLALFSVGLQLRLGQIAGRGRLLALGLLFKLGLAPLAIYLLYVPVLGAQGLAIQVTLFEAAMPPMITAAIVASEHGLDPPLANLMVAVGILVSFLTLYGWWRFLVAV